MNKLQRKRAFRDYIACALWASCDDNGEPLDSVYSIDDINKKSLLAQYREWSEFAQDNAELIAQSGLSPMDCAHDFWLTRNRHGAGFWDRGIGNIGKQLTDRARDCGSVDAIIGDDGSIYFY